LIVDHPISDLRLGIDQTTRPFSRICYGIELNPLWVESLLPLGSRGVRRSRPPVATEIQQTESEVDMRKGTKPANSNHLTVGYCNPPERTRFKKGQSGNPNGRPKGSLNMATVLERTLREKVIINQNGRRKTVTKLEAALKQLIDKATSGELKALQLLSALVRSAEEREVQEPAANSVLDQVDEKVVLGIMKRFEASRKGDHVNEPETETQ
jgi:hypothetical protein